MIPIIRKIKASRAGFPYRDKSFWPAYHISFGKPAPNGAEVLDDIYDAKVGDVVAIFQKDGIQYRYKLNSIERASGSDHIVSPLKFDITYHSSAASAAST